MPVTPHVFTPDADGDCTRCPLPESHPNHVPPAVQALPETPYAGTSGWSGSDTSRERAEDADADGTTTERQAKVLAILGARGSVGATWREIARDTGWHHGQASGALSVLHKQGRIVRLAVVRRERCAAYVLPEWVEGREAAAHGRDRLTREERAALERVEAVVDSWQAAPDPDDVRTIAEALRRLAP